MKDMNEMFGIESDEIVDEFVIGEKKTDGDEAGA